MKSMGMIAVSAMLLAGMAGAADVYQWKDERGRTVFSDRPPAGTAARKLGASVNSIPVPAATSPQGKDANPASKAALAGKSEAALLNGKVDAFNQQVREDNCRTARSNLERLQSAKPRDEALLQSAQAMQQEWCAQ